MAVSEPGEDEAKGAPCSYDDYMRIVSAPFISDTPKVSHEAMLTNKGM
jgi:hypothetical protein